ncbi:TetR/AcrR family transcriptional regulator [Actinacidiphila bryophytorum]|uniref:TetR/AcrR family transcriptional regulator n=1 Tax=Actinacidiphila bryophytorum TaxID=1436133 RepID=UPI002176E732|nr:TetR/AcrR family transcriptional regulator [Actinacidiphila bryophytorum]UWE13292.1 TetR/AcrR family transcriptional regulator [Actinacidiphila bryophytorum]
MPKVSEEHREARRRQILDAAWVCFARNGFHKTSMPDVFAEAGLSAGAVYRYFPGKEALITAIAEVSTQQLIDLLDERLAADVLPPPEELLPAIVEDLPATGGSDPAAMAPQVWSEMMRDPRLAAAVAGMLGDIHLRLTELCRRYQEAGLLDPGLDPGDTARVVIALIQGWIIQWNTMGLAAHQQITAGVRALLARPRTAEQGQGG